MSFNSFDQSLITFGQLRWNIFVCRGHISKSNAVCIHKHFSLAATVWHATDDIYTTCCWLITAVFLAASLLWSDFNSNIDAFQAHTQKDNTKLGSNADFLPIFTQQINCYPSTKICVYILCLIFYLIGFNGFKWYLQIDKFDEFKKSFWLVNS